MDNDFEQQFMQSVKASQPTQPQAASGQPKPRGNTSVTPFIIAIVVLGFALLLESVVLVFFAVDYFKVQTSYPGDYYDEGVDESGDGGGKYLYNSNSNITALNVTCTAEDGSVYNLDFERKFQLSSGASGVIDSGTYSIVNDSVVTLNNGSKVVYFDGDFIADGTKLYDCGV